MAKVTRRDILRKCAIGVTPLLLPNVSFSAWGANNRGRVGNNSKFLIFIILRGGMDGLAAVAPYGDKNYQKSRGDLALPMPGEVGGVIDIDGFFGLHPAMSSLKKSIDKKELAVIHGVAIPSRTRSHFDAQDILESGLNRRGVSEGGWLNRTLPSLRGHSEFALAISNTVPLVLQGDHPVRTWAPKHYHVPLQKLPMPQLLQMYDGDPVLGEFLRQGVETERIAKKAMKKHRSHRGKKQFPTGEAARILRSCGAIMTEPNGPRVAVLGTDGWDTHAAQGGVEGGLANNLRHLSEALAQLPDVMGEHWKNTAVVVATEFGRTVAPNGTGGTDHGTGTAALVMGGSVRGGKVYGQWQGLDKGALFEGRDLYPTMDVRSVFKAALAQHYGLNINVINRDIFPNSVSIPAVSRLFV